MKPKRKPDNPEQYKRFLKTAREVGADKPGEAVDRLFDQVARSKPSIPAERKGSRKGSSG